MAYPLPQSHELVLQVEGLTYLLFYNLNYPRILLTNINTILTKRVFFGNKPICIPSSALAVIFIVQEDRQPSALGVNLKIFLHRK